MPGCRKRAKNDEAALQRAIVQWAGYQADVRDYLFAIPNGGLRTLQGALHLRLQGVRPGVSDLFLALPRGGYHGLFIECKTPTGRGRLSEEQQRWIERVSRVGYLAIVVDDFQQATEFINNYSRGTIQRGDNTDTQTENRELAPGGAQNPRRS